MAKFTVPLHEEKIIQAAKKEEAIEHCNEKFELEMENEMLKQKLAELQSRDQEQVAKISDLTEVVQAVSTELEELKASIKRMQQDALPLEAIEYQSDDSLNEKFMKSLKIEAKANQISDGFIIAYESNILKRFNYLLSKQADDIPLKWKVSVVASQVIRELKEIRFKGNKQIIALYKIKMDSDTKEIKKICDTANIDDSLPRPLKSKSFVTMCYEEICLQNCDFNIHAAEFLANYATKNNLAWKAGGTNEQKKRTIK